MVFRKGGGGVNATSKQRGFSAFLSSGDAPVEASNSASEKSLADGKADPGS